MIRGKVENAVGQLSNQHWMDTCTIVTETLIARRNYRIRNDFGQLLILCTGVADAIKKGIIKPKGMSA